MNRSSDSSALEAGGPRNLRRIRRARRTLAVTIVGLLAGGVMSLKMVDSRVVPITVDQAVARFRSQVATTESATPADAVDAGAATDGGKQNVAVATLPVVAVHPASRSQASTPSVVSASRSSGSVAPATTSVTPAPGVYVYATQGYEQVDVLGGSRHGYPDQTTMTVSPTACGNDVRWDGLQERWDQWTTCASGHAISLLGFVTYHNFYGQVLKQTYTCDPGTQFRPEASAAGTTFAGRCSSGSATAEIAGTVVGTENVNVGSTAVPALRVRLDEKLTGDTRGTRTSDSWYALTSGLLLKRTSLTDADTQATFGATRYHEELTVSATTLTPRQ